MSTPVRSLRAVRSIPKLRGLHSSSKKATPSHLLSSIQSQYSALTVNALKTECKTRGLRVSGRKSELIDRIVAFEATQQFSTSAQAKTVSSEVSVAAKNFSTTASVDAKNDSSSIDYFRMPEDVLADAPVDELPSRMVVPPDAHYKAAEHAPHKVKQRIPDESGTAVVFDASGSRVISNLTEEDGAPKQHRDEEPCEDELPGRDKTILWGLVAGVAAWWTGGSLLSSRKNKE
ncbi:Altered inheritance of mitochondria protein 34, mitochondrial [Wickerhamiella sorbophila]|uniref:Altered inheritance of mitochondria protein 34, mitochondrial n=1 Tax=Wickerhamiella sorbophila TaxID=45607 RepID=A0A2T0FG97_9ASCO|nr:Altered inheritance of mitochondria protein 34, mitochondrial [Wickerhamiella sorbophila]PRT53987.1 Altered inheritance of mitochondria protein 34, mitochondrial [Wickerhamiella sorbophila]